MLPISYSSFQLYPRKIRKQKREKKMSSSSSFCFSYSNIFLPLLAILFLLSHPTSADHQAQDLIDKICRQMEQYGFCDQTFHENLNSPVTDIVGLTNIALTQSLSNATNTHEFITQLLRKETNAAVKNALVACENAYRLVLSSFQDAIPKFFRKNYQDVYDSIQGAPRAQASCDTSFQIPPNPKNPLTDRNREMRILIAMSLVTSHDLPTIN